MRAFLPAEQGSGRAVCVLGTTVRRELFGSGDPLGASIRVGKVSCLVIGELESKGQSGMGQDQDDLVLMPLRTVQRRLVGDPGDFGWSNYAGFFGGTPGSLPGEPDLLLAQIDPDLAGAQARLRTFLERERIRIERGLHRPGLSAKDLQANHFDWLLEEAALRKGIVENFKPQTLAVYWAQEAGFHRGAVAKALGGPMSGDLRRDLSRLRRWLLEDPARTTEATLP